MRNSESSKRSAGAASISLLLKPNCCLFVCPDCIKEMEE